MEDLVRKVRLPDGFEAPRTLTFEDVTATAIARDDLADDVRGINASLDLIPVTRARRWPTGPVTKTTTTTTSCGTRWSSATPCRSPTCCGWRGSSVSSCLRTTERADPRRPAGRPADLGPIHAARLPPRHRRP